MAPKNQTTKKAPQKKPDHKQPKELVQNKPYKVMVQFIRDKKRTPIGVMVAFLSKETIRVGWSKCKMAEDYFDRIDGKNRALKRAASSGVPKKEDLTIPQSIQASLDIFTQRAKNYYKTNQMTIYGTGSVNQE